MLALDWCSFAYLFMIKLAPATLLSMTEMVCEFYPSAGLPSCWVRPLKPF